MREILVNAGRDVSHWFRNGHLKTQISPNTNTETAFTMRAIPDMLAGIPRSLAEHHNAWWMRMDSCVGRLTRAPRKIRVRNMLTGHEDIVLVSRA